VFRLEVLPNGRKPEGNKPKRTYRNPILLALEWKRMLDSREYSSQTDLSRKVGVSRARINQYLRLLKLPPEIQKTMVQMGKLSSPREITERRLRTLLSSAQVDRKGDPPPGNPHLP
jgi:ParB-like chromosome segregation protein Spo0J